MTRNGIVGTARVCALMVALTQSAFLSAQGGAATKSQAATSSIGSVHIPRKVMADGQTLPAGTYVLRVSDAAVTPVTGQTPSAAKWIEFVQGGVVKGREIATVLTAADAKQIAKLGRPGAGESKVEALKGNDYVRVWVNKAGTNYIIHLGNATM